MGLWVRTFGTACLLRSSRHPWLPAGSLIPWSYWIASVTAMEGVGGDDGGGSLQTYYSGDNNLRERIECVAPSVRHRCFHGTSSSSAAFSDFWLSRWRSTVLLPPIPRAKPAASIAPPTIRMNEARNTFLAKFR